MIIDSLCVSTAGFFSIPLAPETPLVWEELDTNLCVDSDAGHQAATEATFGGAAHIVRLETTINRVTGVPMELRAAVGVYDEMTERYSIYTSAGGGVVRQRDEVAAVLGVATAAVRVVSGDIGKISVSATTPILNWLWSRGRPGEWGARLNGRASAATRSLPISMAAT
jgi:molybdopterin-binding aldehyde dehydrogenase-like protein